MLKETIKIVIGALLRFFGIYFIIREVICKNKTTIIVYHDPRPETFKNHIEYLSKHYNFIPLNRLVNAIQKKDKSDIPPKSLVITMDDGFKSNYKLLNIFKTYNITPTIYLCSHIINTNRHFWWKTGYPNLRKLKKMPNDLMFEELRDKVNYEQEKEYLERQALTMSEIVEMLPYVDFGSHSKTHPILINCSKDKCQDEIANSKEYLEHLLGKAIEDFSFPNGDYTSREIQCVKESGYRSARTLNAGWNDINSDICKLKVMVIQDDASINVLCSQISGFFPFLRFLYSQIKYKWCSRYFSLTGSKYIKKQMS